MKKKNGFTLIELLVTIALMLSILGIAIVSFINISNKKKEDAWGEVKSQVETAATEYFTANEYMFEGLADGSSGYVSIGKLEEEDYISKVTNPTTGKSVNKCTLVKVTKKGSNLIAAYDGSIDNTNCGGDYRAYTAEPGAPSASILYQYKSGDQTVQTNYAPSWFNASNGEPKLLVTGKTNGNGSIKSIQILEEVTNGDSASYNITDETNGKNVQIIVTNVSNKKYVVTTSYKRDITLPNINISIASKDKRYATSTANVTINASDSGSGLNNVKTNIKNTNGKTSWNLGGRNSWSPTYDGIVSSSYNGASVTPNIEATDVAGNYNSNIANKYTVYRNCTESITTKTEGSYGSCTKACGGGTQTRTDITNVKDKYTGASCPGDGGESKVSQSCNERNCCSKTEEYGDTNWGKWSDKCNSSDKRTRTGTKNLRSAYDHKTSCGTTQKSDTKDCDLKPQIAKVQFRYNSTKCPNGWVEIRYKDINMAKYSASFTYKHSVQGTTATASTTDKSSALDETFCRGYGSSKNNVMTFSVTFTNNSSKKSNTYSGSCKYSKMWTGNSYNRDWHDCSMD